MAIIYDKYRAKTTTTRAIFLQMRTWSNGLTVFKSTKEQVRKIDEANRWITYRFYEYWMKNNGDDQSSQFIYFGENEKNIDNLKFNIIFFLILWCLWSHRFWPIRINRYDDDDEFINDKLVIIIECKQERMKKNLEIWIWI